jgi:leucyl-tRNA---protein transferase
LLAYHKTLVPDSLSGSELDRYLAMGWYRMNQSIFTTTHLIADEIHRVHWLRFPLLEIRDGASHGRIRRRTRSFKVIIENFTSIRLDHKELYSRYRGSIDFNGPLSIQQCLWDAEDAHRNLFRTQCISVFDEDKLIAGGYFDLGDRSAASILHFFDPAYKRYSLGRYLMLLTVDYLKACGYEFYYPGYVITGNPKMDYKLFMGKGAAQYFDPETGTWMHFQNRILNAEEYSESDKLEVILALLD